MNSENFFCSKCKKMLKIDSVNKTRYCPDCNPDYFIKHKNQQRISKRIRDGRYYYGVKDAGEIVYLSIDYFDGTCKLQFKLEKSNQLDIIKEVINWTNSKIITKAKIGYHLNSNKFILSINGHGNDNRCRWCNSFKTALTASLNIEKQKRCRFDF